MTVQVRKFESAVTLRICVDCLMLLANGDVIDGDGNDITTEHGAKMDEQWPDTEITLGCADPDCDDDGEECGFSWQPCDGCDSRLGGDRYHATAWINEKEA